MRLIHIFIAAFFALQGAAFAQQELVPRHGFTAEQSRAMAVQNAAVAARQTTLRDLLPPSLLPATSNVLPWAEYGQAGYLIFSDTDAYGTLKLKLKMAQELPKDMTLVIYTTKADKTYQKALFARYAEKIDASRLKVVQVSKPKTQFQDFWARDGVPVPTWKLNSLGQKKLNLVDAAYYHRFEADADFANYFSASLFSHDYLYEGGNYAVNERGDCIVVDNERVATIPDSIFLQNYGCKTLLRMPYVFENGVLVSGKGIGHIDETVKFMDNDTVVSDDDEYISILKSKGFKVVTMPRPQREYETYVNSLIVNGTAFVPVFNEPGDVEAINIYEEFGLKVVPLDSRTLSNDGLGSLHCITMVYPPVPFNELLEYIGADDVQ